MLFVWSGDTAGQGWGINRDWGGMKIYESMRRLNPDFFVHSGDIIYADGAIKAEVKLDDGTLWRNLVTEEKSKVAETLKEFRGNFAYNLMDEHLRRFNAEVPGLYQWDDHETTNNWYPGRLLTTDDRYTVKSCDLLAARARRAFFEYTPTRHHPDEHERIYRAIHYGPHLDVFMLDMRTYRAANSVNTQPQPGPDTAFLGNTQINWLKKALLESTATWKVIAADMPLGLIVWDNFAKCEGSEALANGDHGLPSGREHELADLLSFIKRSGIGNVAWITADVHYAAAHYYDPNQAKFSEFDPFWEFVAGPLNAGTFGPNELDRTFGPHLVFKSIPDGIKPNRPPTEGMQFFGSVKIDGKTGQMTVRLHGLDGKVLFARDLEPKTV